VAAEKDDKYKEIIVECQTNQPTYSEEKFICSKDNLILYKNIVYVPNDVDLKILILTKVHQKPYSGHLGYQKTITVLKK
jgi:hypothetical protein